VAVANKQIHSHAGADTFRCVKEQLYGLQPRAGMVDQQHDFAAHGVHAIAVAPTYCSTSAIQQFTLRPCHRKVFATAVSRSKWPARGPGASFRVSRSAGRPHHRGTKRLLTRELSAYISAEKRSVKKVVPSPFGWSVTHIRQGVPFHRVAVARGPPLIRSPLARKASVWAAATSRNCNPVSSSVSSPFCRWK
jgi:hypothetical protein